MAFTLIEQVSKPSITSDKRSTRIQIDGSILEGGGQILRNASAYSCILRKPVQITNIRERRPKPGLKQQHLSGLQLLRQLTGGLLEGGQLESREILLRPGTNGVLGSTHECSHQGAGSTTLLLQSALPLLLFAPQDTTLLLRGGTDALTTCPPVDFTRFILLPFLKRHFGIECDLHLRKRGFPSFGGGELSVEISALKSPLKCISLLERGDITSFTAQIWTARESYEKVIKALEDSITTELKKTYPKISLTITRTSLIPSPTCATGVTIYGHTTQGHRLSSSTLIELPTRLTPTILSKQEVKARERGAQVVGQLLKEISQGGVVDEYLADQIIIFMALATSGVLPPIAMDRGVTVDAGKKRRSEVLVGQVSLHTETAMRIAEMMLGNVAFSTKNVEGSGITIMCDETG